MVAPAVEFVCDKKLALVSVRTGALHLFARPEKGKRYVFGVDTASGAAGGDFNACVGLEVTSGDHVCTMHGRREDAAAWGQRCAYLAWYFNTALLSFETHPSQHGLAACLAAKDEGYPMLYRRAQVSTVTQGFTSELGWATTSKTKQLLISAAVQAIAAGFKIHDERLVTELLEGRYTSGGELEFENHDDLFIAWSIALQTRRHALSKGFVSDEEPAPVDFNKAWWKHRQEKWDLGSKGATGKRPRLFDGI